MKLGPLLENGPEKTHTLPRQTAEALHELKTYRTPYGGYTPIHDEQTDTRRWVSTHRLIIRRDSDHSLWALPYEMPLTEYQDCDTFLEPGAVTVHRVRAEQVTVNRYVDV
ncbi:hypothetical protein [Nocardiopsis sp. LOL_012]|uniref:hypothetical protein n=1 Tax=Nocardiopsis sp. LOL_012 TaxID=3345409 RepID=UPI003A84046E